MNSRERLLKTLNHEEPDRVPVDLGGIVTGITKVVHRRLREHLGVEGREQIIDRIQQLVKPDEKILERLEVDTRYVYLRASRDFQDKEFPVDVYEDEWGVRRKRVSFYYDIVHHPLKDATIQDLERMRWPDPHAVSRYEGIAEEVRYLHKNTDYAIILNAIGSIFEFSWYLRGYEQFMMDLLINRGFAVALMEKMLQFQIGMFEEILDRVGDYVQVVLCGDDLAIQTGPAISLNLYRKLVKPLQRQLFESIKKRTGAKLFYHSCGSVYQFIGDLLEIGIDILNPIQVSAQDMDTKRLKKEFGKELTFWGGCDTQRVLPFGTPDEVKDEVKKRIDDLAEEGGFVLNSVHNIQADVPPENILAMFDMARDYGKHS